MLQKAFFILLLVSVPYVVSAQSQESTERVKHRIYTEIGTYIFLNTITLNYEPTIYESSSNTFRLNGRMGLGLGWVLGFDGDHGVSGAMGGLTMDFGRKNSHFLLSSGMIVATNFTEIDELSTSFDRLGAFPLLELGWRYEKPQGGWTYKVAGGTLGLSFGLGYSF